MRLTYYSNTNCFPRVLFFFFFNLTPVLEVWEGIKYLFKCAKGNVSRRKQVNFFHRKMRVRLAAYFEKEICFNESRHELLSQLQYETLDKHRWLFNFDCPRLVYNRSALTICRRSGVKGEWNKTCPE